MSEQIHKSMEAQSKGFPCRECGGTHPPGTIGDHAYAPVDSAFVKDTKREIKELKTVISELKAEKCPICGFTDD
jgi:hypothetical protein